MAERMISPVGNTSEKQITYRTYMAKHSRAMQNEFYFEALLIDYAVLEDRFRSFLYHMGLFKSRNSRNADVKAVKDALTAVIDEYKSEKEDSRLNVNTVTGKMKIIRCVSRWAMHTETPPEDSRYLCILKNRLDGLDTEKLLRLLSETEIWCKYRNEVIHSLLNKNTDSVNERLAEMAERGMTLAKEADSFVRHLKRGSAIRKRMDLPVESKMGKNDRTRSGKERIN